ncbi:MAG: DUF1295 domain-containing protein [Microbacteriaceae bacterium]
MSRTNRSVLMTIIVVLAIGALVAVAGAPGSAEFAGVPLFSLAVAAAFIIQIIVYLPAMLMRTEKFFDLTGAMTFTLISIALLVLAPSPDTRSWVLAAMVILWAVRLGPFLFLRVRKAGSDKRFDNIKEKPLVFLRVWILQGLWVSLTASAAWIAMSSEASLREPIGWLSIIGIVLWVFGITFELTADLQKSAFKADPKNTDTFIHTGLWSLSRHPNYFGEIVLWAGVFLVAVPVLNGWQWIVLLSPIFVTILLTRISGVPMLEAGAEKRWGGQADYKTYKEQTPVLIPRLTIFLQRFE